jgi:ketosteroid isomerase-like protein
MADQGDDAAAVRAANEAFYAAVESADLDALHEVWGEDEGTVCVHPGASPVHGRAAVMRSWALIMANTDYIQFFLTDVQVSVAGDTAALTCTENILTGEDRSEAFRGGRARALTVFKRSATGWRVWIHQAAPVGSEHI